MSMLSDSEVYNLLGHKVQIDLDSGNNSKKEERTIGHLMTRDPVSHSLVIAKIGEENKIETIEWIPSGSVKAIRAVEGEEKSDVIDKYFETKEGSSEDTEEDIRKRYRALKVVNYLKSHHLDVSENATTGTYIIVGAVRFEAPHHHENLYCDIPLVLKRILKLVEEI